MAFFNFWLKVKDFDYFFYMFFSSLYSAVLEKVVAITQNVENW